MAEYAAYRVRGNIQAMQWFPGVTGEPITFYTPKPFVLSDRRGGTQEFPQEGFWCVIHKGHVQRLHSGDWIVKLQDDYQVHTHAEFVEMFEKVQE